MNTKKATAQWVGDTTSQSDSFSESFLWVDGRHSLDGAGVDLRLLGAGDPLENGGDFALSLAGLRRYFDTVGSTDEARETGLGDDRTTWGRSEGVEGAGDGERIRLRVSGVGGGEERRAKSEGRGDEGGSDVGSDGGFDGGGGGGGSSRRSTIMGWKLYPPTSGE